MEIKELYTGLRKNGLGVVWSLDGKQASIGSPHFANPLLWFNAYEEDYKGSVQVKSINITLFSETQIKTAILLVDNFLQTPLNKRGLSD